MSDDPAAADKSMTYGVIGVLVMLDVFFISNYYIIKGLRSYTDAYAATLPKEKDFGGAAEAGAAGGFVEKIVLGFLIGKVKAVPLSIQRFPSWRPIKYRAGLIFTSVFVLISLLVLNPSMVTPEGTDVGGLTLQGEFCSEFDRETALTKLRYQVLNMTNLDQAVRQHAYMRDFKGALLNDTTRYGERNVGDCAEIPETDNVRGLTGNKDEWSDVRKFPASEFGTFFPGYCQSARELAIQMALTTTCEVTQCACPRLPNTGAFKFFGVGGDEVCIMRVCASSPNACPGQTNDYLGNSNNYREAQLNETEAPDPTIGELQAQGKDIGTEAAQAGLKFFLYQVDIASNFYAIYSVVALYFPTPLIVFRLPYLIAIKRFLFGTEQNIFIILFVSLLWIFEYMRSFIVSADFQVFITNLVAGDPCFLDGAYVYARYDEINIICDQLVPLEPDFDFNKEAVKQIWPEIKFFAAPPDGADPGCNCAFPMVDLYAFRETEKPDAVELGFTESSKTDLGIPKFCDRKGDDCAVLFPPDGIQFLGNSTLCLDSEEMKELAVQAPESEVNWDQMQELWLDSGLLASFLVKIAMTNFALGLARLADPFVTCAGEFLWIPAKLGTGLGGRDKNTVFHGFMLNKLGTLRNVNLRTVIVWGFIMHICLYNIFKSSFSTGQTTGVSLSDTDRTLLLFTSACSMVIIVFTVCLNCFLKVGIRKYKKRAQGGQTESNDGDDENDDDDDDGSADDGESGGDSDESSVDDD
eukprot:CAMPEP_0119007304 /NCGR_PEP_ID=MMETSP1176-20130426/2921_1 /TAXON_ID=265551 /ORGANISM="Synedropsis recta cf, Strain CCMP1620" /LENGTH=750 /DNA_ID=CAMNT_0006959423 /DNA_START=35 /DNA_END=2284 /DNA_ORIENTATION=+